MSDSDSKSDLERSFEELSLSLEPVEPAPADQAVDNAAAPSRDAEAGLSAASSDTLSVEPIEDATADDSEAREPTEPALDSASVPLSSELAESPLTAPAPESLSGSSIDHDDDVDSPDEVVPAQEASADAANTEPVSLAAPVPPRRSATAQLKTTITDLGHRMFAEPVGITVSVVVLLASTCLLIWSVFFRLDILDEVVALEMKEIDLASKHGSLSIELSKINQDAVRSEIEEQNARIFNGFPAVASWIKRITERAEGMNMNVRYRVGESVMAPVDDVLEVPVIIEFEVASEDDGGLFRRGMALIESLLEDHWHLDISSTAAAGDGSGMRTLELEARLWVFDNEEFLAPQMLVDNGSSNGMEVGPDAEFVQ